MLVFSTPRRHAVARRLRCVAAYLLLLSFPFASSAAPAEAPAPLRDALAAAWRQHPSARATAATVTAARARADAAARPLYNPELELTSEHEGADRTRTIGARLELDLAGKRAARSAAGTAKLDQELARAHKEREDFAARWLTGWAGWRTATQRARIGAQRHDLLVRVAALAEKQFKVGDISSLDRDLALLARDESQAELAALEAERTEAEAAFVQVGGVPGTALTVSPDALPEPGAGAAANLARLPTWQLADAEVAVAERAVAVAEHESRPDPSVSLAVGRTITGADSGNVVRATVSVPLFVRNTYRSEVVAARADADAAAAEADRVKLELMARARRADAVYAAVREAWTRWHASPGTAIDRRTDLLERLWRAGELSTPDYLQQLKQTLDTALAGAELEGRLWRSAVEDLDATGQLASWCGLDATTGEPTR